MTCQKKPPGFKTVSETGTFGVPLLTPCSDIIHAAIMHAGSSYM